MGNILQIVPHAPGTYEAVGHYALTLAERLATTFERETVFAAFPSASSQVNGFQILSPLATLSEHEILERDCEHLILHYVNYGYHDRGIPFWLVATVRRLRHLCRGRFLTIFHEVYASGPPWKSEFWLQPFQIHIARQLARLADTCIVSDPVSRARVLRLHPRGAVSTQPVFSNFGEPEFSGNQLRGRDPHRWVICGGTHLIERSLRSFRERLAVIPARCQPHELFVVGGSDNAAVRQTLENLPEVKSFYFPQTSVARASEVLSSCAWGFIDYFHRRDVETAMILKSGSFAACCAHGVIPVFPHPGSTISLNDDSLPGPYYIDANRLDLPSNGPDVAEAIHAWYWRRASSEHLAQTVALALGLVTIGDACP